MDRKHVGYENTLRARAPRIFQDKSEDFVGRGAREILSFFILDSSVLGLRPRVSAAPCAARFDFRKNAEFGSRPELQSLPLCRSHVCHSFFSVLALMVRAPCHAQKVAKLLVRPGKKRVEPQGLFRIFFRGTVVASYIEDQRVVAIAELVECVDEPASHDRLA